MEFFPDVDVSAIEAEAIARGLYAVAVVDGVHERELALIAELYRGNANEGATVASLGQISALGPQDLSALLPRSVVRELFVKSAYLLAWVDGQVSTAERDLIGQFARVLAVSPESEAALEAQVKDYLLDPLVRLANVEAVMTVAKKLGA
jgi:hypothetical protein